MEVGYGDGQRRGGQCNGHCETSEASRILSACCAPRILVFQGPEARGPET